MHPYGDPSNPQPSPPPTPPAGSRSRGARIVGWVLAALGLLVAFGGLIGGSGFGGRVGGALLGAAIAIVGAMLIRPFTSWKVAGPGAALALVVALLILPSAPKEPTPASGLVGPTSFATVTSSETRTVTVTATTTSAPPSSTTSSASPTTTTTTTVAAPPNPAVAETNTRTPVPALAPTPTRTATPQVPSGGTPYRSCAAARAAGAAPLYRGQPGYSSDLDRDGDGVACESRR